MIKTANSIHNGPAWMVILMQGLRGVEWRNRCYVGNHESTGFREKHVSDVSRKTYGICRESARYFLRLFLEISGYYALAPFRPLPHLQSRIDHRNSLQQPATKACPDSLMDPPRRQAAVIAIARARVTRGRRLTHSARDC
jgi:hypothetical protein